MVDDLLNADNSRARHDVEQTESIEGGEMVVKLFDAMTAGSTARLNLQLLECAVAGSDAARASEQEASARRKQHQCLYLRGHSTVFGAIISPQIVYASYCPHFGSISATRAAIDADSNAVEAKTKDAGKDSRGMPARGARGRRANNNSSSGNNTNVSLSASTKKRANQPVLSTVPSGAPSVGGSSHSVGSCSSVKGLDDNVETNSATRPRTLHTTGSGVAPVDFQLESHAALVIPRSWQMFLRMHRQQQQHDSSKAGVGTDGEQSTRLSRSQTRSLVLDIWIEFIKVDLLQLENASLGALAPFVCDYFVGRYDVPAAVGSWLESLIAAMCAHHEDPRVRFFAGACGVFSSQLSPTPTDPVAMPGVSFDRPELDTVLYYLHVLAHLFYGQMKIFKRENHLTEGSDGGCAIDVEVAQATAAIIFGFTLTRSAIDGLQRELAALPRVVNASSSLPASTIDTASDGAGARRSTLIGPTCGAIELDDVMAIFIREWQKRLEQIDEVRPAWNLGGSACDVFLANLPALPAIQAGVCDVRLGGRPHRTGRVHQDRDDRHWRSRQCARVPTRVR